MKSRVCAWSLGVGKGLTDQLKTTKESLFETKESLQQVEFANKELESTVQTLKDELGELSSDLQELDAKHLQTLNELTMSQHEFAQLDQDTKAALAQAKADAKAGLPLNAIERC